MKKLIALIITLALSSSFVFSQTSMYSKVISNTYGVQANCIASAEDSTYIVAGGMHNYWRGLVLKININGDIIWNKTFHKYSLSSYDNYFKSLIVCKDSTYMAVGSNYDSVANKTNIFYVKLNVNGNPVWSKTITVSGLSSYGNSIQQTFDSGYIITGYACSYIGTNNRIFVAKIDVSGNLQWAKQLVNGSNSEQGLSVIQAQDSGYLITGYNTSNNNPVLVKLSHNGNVSWSKTFKPLEPAYIYNAQYTNNGILFFVAGTLMKLDFSGNVLWAKDYDILAFNLWERYSPKLCKTSDGGWAFIPVSNNSLYTVVIKVDSLGSIIWAKQLYLAATDLIETDDKGIILVGNGPLFGVKSGLYSKSDSDETIGLIKLDSLGNGTICMSDISVLADTGAIGDSAILYTPVNGASVSSMNVTTESVLINCALGCVPIYGNIKENNSETLFTIFPNPTTGKLFLQNHQSMNDIETIEIYDCLGRLQLSQTFASDEIDVSNLPNGIYFVKVFSSHAVYVQKIIKE